MEKISQIFDFAIAFDYDFDADFIHLLEKAASEQNLSSYVIRPFNLSETLKLLKNDKIQFNFYYDRASDTSNAFLELYNFLSDKKVPIFDKLENIIKASDKATMHLEFITNGIYVPYTIIIPPFETTAKITLSVEDLAKLGRQFIIKPANTTGGGTGVISGAETLNDVLIARQQYFADKYLLQEIIHPLVLDNKRFWFRIFYICGTIITAWWNDITHVYEILTEAQLEQYQLQQLHEIMNKIAKTCGLNFFSSEIAFTADQRFIVVDYVNEICDMRLQSKFHDGVPDNIVQQIAETICIYVKHKLTDSN